MWFAWAASMQIVLHLKGLSMCLCMDDDVYRVYRWEPNQETGDLHASQPITLGKDVSHINQYDIWI